jgi:hypothetical protein
VAETRSCHRAPDFRLPSKRLRNLKHHPRCALLLDHYTDVWDQLWWVRLRTPLLPGPLQALRGLSIADWRSLVLQIKVDFQIEKRTVGTVRR